MSSILQPLGQSNYDERTRTDLSDSLKEDYVIVQFEGIDDTWDPKNFSPAKKWLILSVVTHGAAIVTCASSLYVSSPLHLAI